MTKGYLGRLQCSPKDGMIPNRVRHLFIFPACLYPLPSEPVCGFFPSRVVGKDIHPSFLQRSNDPSFSVDVISSVVRYSGDLGGINFNTFLTDNETQQLTRTNTKSTLIRIQAEFILPQTLE